MVAMAERGMTPALTSVRRPAPLVALVAPAVMAARSEAVVPVVPAAVARTAIRASKTVAAAARAVPVAPAGRLPASAVPAE
jgi:hypothetical protein